MTTIASVHARQILDSRGNPTVEVDVVTDAGALGRAAVPSGASTGSHEAVERRDGGSAYGGKAVEGAVASVNGELGPALLGHDVHDQRGVDRLLCELDGTPDKGRIGANGVLGVSLAVAKASAAALGLPLWRSLGGPSAHVLPVPMMNVINGGAHADNALDLQEFMVVPHGAESFAEALRIGSEVYHALKARLHRDGLSTAVGDEGGFAPEISSAEAAIELILAAAGDAGHGDAVGIALDPAMTELYRDGAYHVEGRALELRAARGVVGGAVRALSDPLARGRDGRGRLGRLAAAHRAARRARAARRRRPLRDQSGAARRGHRAQVSRTRSS